MVLLENVAARRSSLVNNLFPEYQVGCCGSRSDPKNISK